MQRYFIRKSLKRILCVAALNFGSLTLVHSMQEIEKEDPGSSSYSVRVSTQIKSSELRKIIWQNQDNISFAYTLNNELPYHYIGQIDSKDIITKTLNERISLGAIIVPATSLAITLWICYDEEGKRVYNSCFYSLQDIPLKNISLSRVQKGKLEFLSALRLDLDLNSYESEAPVRGNVLVAYNKLKPTPTVVSTHHVGGFGILPTTLEIAKDIVNLETNLKVPLELTREDKYFNFSSEQESDEVEEDYAWAPASQIMYAHSMMKTVADLINITQLSLEQKEVILSYLVHIQKCDRIDIHQLREDLGMPSRKK